MGFHAQVVSPLAAESFHEWGFYGISIHGWKGNSFLLFAPFFSLMLLGDFLEDYIRMTRKTMGSERNLIQGKEKPSSQSSLESQKREIKLFSVVAYCV